MASAQAQIAVVPTVQHLASTSTPSAGAITLAVTGGVSPYNYTWTPGGLTTRDISGQAKNAYVLTVEDSSPATATYTYNIGYKADWDQMYGCSSSNDSLISDASRLWAQAVTKNNLAAGTDGWVEYIFKGTSDRKLFGVSDSLSPLPNTYADDIDYGYYFEGSTNSVYEIRYGGLYNAVVGVPEGTAFRVERSGTTIKFVVNGVTTHTVSDASAAAAVWKVKAMIWDDVAGASFVNMGCSFSTKGNVTFKNYSNMVPFTVHSAGSGLNDGSIRISPLKTGTYTYTWQPGTVTSATLTSKPAGEYTLSAKDATNTITPGNYTIGYKVKWDQPYRCSVRQDSLIGVNLGLDAWESAISKNTLSGGADGWFEYVLRDMDQYRAIGFADSLSPNLNDIYDIDFGFYYQLGVLYGIGVNSYFVPLCYDTNEGTIIRIERRGDTIVYKINGAVVSSDIRPGEGLKDWKVKGVLYAGMNSTLVNAGCSFYTEGNSSFPNYVRLSPTIIHETAPGFNNGGVSVSPVQSGTYTYTWQPGATTGPSVTARPAGTCDVTVKDSQNHTSRISYTIGYKVSWEPLNDCEQRGDTLVTQNLYSFGRAISKNTLAGGTDGWFEYVLKDLNQIKGIGFTDSLSSDPQNINDIDYGFYYYDATHSLYTLRNGSTYIAATISEGETPVLRVERSGDTIRYLINGIVQVTIIDPVAVAKAWKLKGDVLAYNNSSLVNVGCSFYQQGYTEFPNYNPLIPSIVHASSVGANDGSITVRSEPAKPLSYLWQPGNVTKNPLTDIPAGNYSLSVEDSLHHSNSNYYHVGYKTYWDSVYGAVVKGDTLETTEAYAWGRAISKNTLAANTDGWFEYVLEDLDKIKLVGFLDSMSTDPQDIYDIDYGYYYDAVTHTLYTFFKGSFVIVGQGVEGSVLRVERNADTILFTMNGMPLGNIVDTVDARKPWRIKGIVHAWADTKLVNVGCSFAHDNVLAVGATISNFTNENTAGRIDLNISGGKPHYTIAWNSLKILNNHDFYQLLDSTLSSVDSLSLYSKLDSLRRKQSLTNVPSAIYNNLIIDNAGDTIRETALVGNDFGWLTSGVATTTCVIPADTASGFTVHYGMGQQITKSAPGNAFVSAVSDVIVHPLEREFYVEYRIPRDSDEMVLGFKMADTLNVDTVADMIGNTMLHMRGNGTNSMRIYYNSDLVYTADYFSGDVIGVLLDPLNHKIVYSRNFMPLWTQSSVPDAFFQANYQLKALLKTPLAQLGNIIMVGPVLLNKGISATVTDVTCGSLSSGAIAFSAYTMLWGDKLCAYTVSGPNAYAASGSGSSATLSGLAAGVYTVSIQVRSGSCSGTVLSPMVQTFTVGYMPDWINQAPFGATNVNTTDRSFNITATQSSPYAWLGGASTDNMLDAAEEGRAEFKPVFSGSVFPFSNRAMAFGLTSQDQGTHPSGIDHRFYVASNLLLQTIGLGSGSSQSVGPYTASMFSLGTVGAILNVSPTDVLKISKVPLSSGLNMKMEFYKNNVLVGTGGVTPSTELIADASVNQKDLYISKPRISFGCDKRTPNYFILRKILDAGYYMSYRKSIYFAFEEEYFDPSQGSAGSLSYTIVSDKNVPVSAAPGLVERIGDNRFSIDLSAVTGMTQGQFYRIAVTNKKNEVFYARFKY